jgi:hypothetical protein
MAVVAAFWIYVLATLPAHYDEGDRVFARIAFEHSHDLLRPVMWVAVVSMLVASVATVVHVAYALILRSVRVIPVGSAAVATIAAQIMIPSTAVYMDIMADFGPAHLRWVLPAELVAAVVLAVAGGASWRIARRDRAPLLVRPIPAARGTIRTVHRTGGHHDRQGADPRSD